MSTTSPGKPQSIFQPLEALRVDGISCCTLIENQANHCNVEIAEWFPAEMDRQRLLDLLAIGRPKFCELSTLEKVEAWLRSQSGY